jgi:hypothetical protein
MPDLWGRDSPALQMIKTVPPVPPVPPVNPVTQADG